MKKQFILTLLGLVILTSLVLGFTTRVTNTESIFNDVTAQSLNVENFTSSKLNGEYYVQASNATDIQHKIDKCTSGWCIVHLPVGTYDLASPIRLSHTGIILEGEGVGTLIRIGTNATAIILGDKTEGYNAAMQVRNLKINPISECSKGDSQIGIYNNYSKFNTIEGADIVGLCGYGIKLDNWARYNKILMNNIEMEYGYALYMEDSAFTNDHNQIVSNRLAVDHEGTALYLNWYGNNNLVEANHLQSVNGSVVIFGKTNNHYSYYNSLQNNLIEYSTGLNNVHYGIFINGTMNSSITNNIIYSSNTNYKLAYCIMPVNNGQYYNDIKGNKCNNAVLQMPALEERNVVNKEAFLNILNTTLGNATVRNNLNVLNSAYILGLVLNGVTIQKDLSTSSSPTFANVITTGYVGEDAQTAMVTSTTDELKFNNANSLALHLYGGTILLNRDDVRLGRYLYHINDTNTYIDFTSDSIVTYAGGTKTGELSNKVDFPMSDFRVGRYIYHSSDTSDYLDLSAGNFIVVMNGVAVTNFKDAEVDVNKPLIASDTVNSSSNIKAKKFNSGNGTTEIFPQDQALKTTSTPSFASITAKIGWTNNTGYPAACSAGQYVSTIGDTLTCGTPTFTQGKVGWTNLTTYPSACSAGQYVSTIGDTLTCGTPTGSFIKNATGNLNMATYKIIMDDKNITGTECIEFHNGAKICGI